ncbi:hypothetical protein C8J57DRAFT_1476444 [Mycena rebaudengoi]|nr:hypothetical protein C8J57DRAFT_1476444 [Mycena rebaudengoi]
MASSAHPPPLSLVPPTPRFVGNGNGSEMNTPKSEPLKLTHASPTMTFLIRKSRPSNDASAGGQPFELRCCPRGLSPREAPFQRESANESLACPPEMPWFGRPPELAREGRGIEWWLTHKNFLKHIYSSRKVKFDRIWCHSGGGQGDLAAEPGLPARCPLDRQHQDTPASSPPVTPRSPSFLTPNIGTPPSNAPAVNPFSPPASIRSFSVSPEQNAAINLFASPGSTRASSTVDVPRTSYSTSSRPSSANSPASRHSALGASGLSFPPSSHNIVLIPPAGGERRSPRRPRACSRLRPKSTAILVPSASVPAAFAENPIPRADDAADGSRAQHTDGLPTRRDAGDEGHGQEARQQGDAHAARRA